MNFLYLLLFLSLSSCSSPKVNNTQSLQSYSFAIVDIQEVEKSTLFIRDLQKTIAKKEKKIGSELLEKKNSIESQYKLLNDKKSTLSQESLQSQALKLEQSFQSLQELEREYSQAFEFAKNQIGRLFTDKVMLFANDVAKDKGISLVFPKVALLYYDEDLINDITDDVLKKINNYGKIGDFNQIFDQAISDIKAHKAKRN